MKISKQLQSLTDAEQYIKDTFQTIQEGQANWGRIVTRHHFYGMTSANDMVNLYTNKGNHLYLVNAPYTYIVTSEQPEMVWTA